MKRQYKETKLSLINKKIFDISYFSDKDKQLRCCLVAKQYTDFYDIKIYNAIRGGNLKCFLMWISSACLNNSLKFEF